MGVAWQMTRRREQEGTRLEKPVLVRLDPQMYERVERVAAADDRKVAAMIRRMLDYALPHFEESVIQDEVRHE